LGARKAVSGIADYGAQAEATTAPQVVRDREEGRWRNGLNH